MNIKKDIKVPIIRQKKDDDTLVYLGLIAGVSGFLISKYIL